jgi:hypothetical protein
MKAKASGTRKPMTRSAPKAPENLKTKPSHIEEESESEEESEQEEEPRDRRRSTQSKNRPSDVPVIIAPHKPKLMPYVSVPPMINPIKVKPRAQEEYIPMIEKRGPAYRHKAPIKDKGDMKEMMERLLGGSITFTTEEILRMTPELREELKKIISKKRVAAEEVKRVTFMDEQEHVEEEVEYLSNFNVATVQVLTQARGGMPKGALVVSDPVVQYFEELVEGEVPKKIVVVTESSSLRALHPIINGNGMEEALLDGGSQIVSMAKDVAVRLKVPWNPEIVIHMQSANRQLEKMLGLARNVPFLFGDITVYLQVHIINNPAYKVLLGRPFDTVCESEVKNSRDGDQLITITDPNTGQRCTLPTYMRGQRPEILKKPTESTFLISMN